MTKGSCLYILWKLFLSCMNLISNLGIWKIITLLYYPELLKGYFQGLQCSDKNGKQNTDAS